MFGWTTDTRHAHRDIADRSAATGGVDSADGFAGHGLLAGTRVASNLGWRAIEALTAGDKILTFDHGMQVIREIKRKTLWLDATSLPDHMRPVTVPAGALGNRVPLRLLPEQGVLVESDAATDAQGDPFAVVAASALVGYRNITHDTRKMQVEIVTLYFEKPEVIYAEGGMLIYCPQVRVDLLDLACPTYDVLSAEEAAFLVECMKYEDLSAPYAQSAGHGSAYAA